MTRVIAALDDSLAAQPVLATAVALARMMGATVEPVHVRVNGAGAAARVAAASGLDVTEVTGAPVDRLVALTSAEDVAAIVLGARRTPGGARPAGSTALSVAQSVLKPLVIVPPDLIRPGRLERVLVPLEGTISSSLAPRQVFELAAKAHLDVVVLHVHEEASLPAFTDQPQHESDAWGREFIARFCPVGVDEIRLLVRVGRGEELVAQTAEDVDADLVALGWSQDLAAGRAAVVRATLDHARRAVMLVPVRAATPITARKEVSWQR